MKGCGDGQEAFADKVKEKPKNQDAQQTLRYPDGSRQATAAGELGLGEFLKAGRADAAVVVLGNAFATKKLAAFEATGDRLTGGMIEAALPGQALHGSNWFGHVRRSLTVARLDHLQSQAE
jgi:hypothetical protein